MTDHDPDPEPASIKGVEKVLYLVRWLAASVLIPLEQINAMGHKDYIYPEAKICRHFVGD